MAESVSLNSVGEYRLHAEIAHILNRANGERMVGDDAAVLDLGAVSGKMSLLATADRVASGVATAMRAKLLVVQTISDIVAMGGRPIGLLLAVQFPRESPLAEAVDFVQAVEIEAQRYGCHLIGGDTKEGSDFTAVGVGLGLVESDKVVRRVPVKKGNLVGVTLTRSARWGRRWAYHLSQHFGLILRPDLATYLANGECDLELPIAESRALTQSGLAVAGLDLSDGLGAGLSILAAANGVRINICPAAISELFDERTVPIAETLGFDPRALVFSPGYMWSNLYAIHFDTQAEAIQAVRGAGGEFVIIGEVINGAPGVVYDGRESQIVGIASDEKFRPWDWHDRTENWVDVVKQSTF